MGGTYLGQVSSTPDLYFPTFQCSSVSDPAENIILGFFWVFFNRTSPKFGEIRFSSDLASTWVAYITPYPASRSLLK